MQIKIFIPQPQFNIVPVYSLYVSMDTVYAQKQRNTCITSQKNEITNPLKAKTYAHKCRELSKLH